MDKKIIIVLTIILIALIGIIFIISSMFSKKEAPVEEPIIEEPIIEEPVVNTLDQVNGLVGNIKIIFEQEKGISGGYISVYENQAFLSSIEALQALEVSNMRSSIDKENGNFCFYLSKDGTDICIDSQSEGILNTPFCTETNVSCLNNKQIVIEEDEVISVSEVEEELILKQEVTVLQTNLKKYSSNLTGEETITINGKEYGPYTKSYIIYNDSEWGLLMEYNSKWYVNINGKAFGPYTERPIVEAYGENMGYSYVKEGEYYVFLSGETYGPYQDLTEFSLGE